MNEEMQNELTRVVKLLADGIEKGAESLPQTGQFALEQVVLYFAASAIASGVFAAALISLSVWLLLQWRPGKAFDQDWTWVCSDRFEGRDKETGEMITRKKRELPVGGIIGTIIAFFCLLIGTLNGYFAMAYAVKAIAPIGWLLAKQL